MQIWNLYSDEKAALIRKFSAETNDVDKRARKEKSRVIAASTCIRPGVELRPDQSGR